MAGRGNASEAAQLQLVVAGVLAGAGCLWFLVDKWDHYRELKAAEKVERLKKQAEECNARRRRRRNIIKLALCGALAAWLVSSSIKHNMAAGSATK